MKTTKLISGLAGLLFAGAIILGSTPIHSNSLSKRVPYDKYVGTMEVENISTGSDEVVSVYAYPYLNPTTVDKIMDPTGTFYTAQGGYSVYDGNPQVTNFECITNPDLVAVLNPESLNP